MFPAIRTFLRFSSVLFVLSSGLIAAPWPAWRGADGSGISTETDLPLTWSATENVKWKVALPERGNSTPIVWGDRVFITQAVGDERLVICFARQDGKELWRGGAKGVAKEPTHEANPYCSASPATDGERVYAWFGSAGLYCFDMAGQQLWQRDLGEQRHMWGYSTGPVLHGDLCYLNFGPGPRTFLLAVDKRTGRDVWRQELGKIDIAMPRNDGFGAKSDGVVGSWSVPIIINAGTREELVMSWPEQVRSYDPKIGQPLWHCRGLNPLIYSTTIFGEGVVVAMGGYSGSTVAVRPGGSGDVTDTHRLWHEPRDKGHIGSGVIKDGHLYILTTNGPLIEQIGEIDAVVVVVAKVEAALERANSTVETGPILGQLPEPLVHRAPQAEGFGIVGRIGFEFRQDRARGPQCLHGSRLLALVSHQSELLQDCWIDRPIGRLALHDRDD